MRILAVDIGTGTQDILLFDTDLQPENCFKMVMPSPTMTVARKVKAATKRKQPILLYGVTMGGGPCQWAINDHITAGYTVYATPPAARTFDDNLDKVSGEMGVKVISEDEAADLAETEDDLIALSMNDFDYGAIASSFEQFGLEVDDVDGVAVAVFDHGAAPADVSDRQFRFDYLDERIKAENRLSAFAYPSDQVPEIMTRMQAVVTSATTSGMPSDIPLMIMDTAPAAVLGATLDPMAEEQGPNLLIANVGNFHTLAFRLGEDSIDGVFEHHTGFLNTDKLDRLIRSLAESTLKHEDVFDDQGHGALVYNKDPMPMDMIIVTGPRRSLTRESAYPTYYAAPCGDMMIAGCFGLVRAWADVYPDAYDAILEGLSATDRGAPWEKI